MGSLKEKKLKDYLIAIRKKSSSGISNAPVWVVQRKGERVWNPKSRRHWRSTTLGKDFRKREKKDKKTHRRWKSKGKNKS